jgi:hypothetical protein
MFRWANPLRGLTNQGFNHLLAGMMLQVETFPAIELMAPEGMDMCGLYGSMKIMGAWIAARYYQGSHPTLKHVHHLHVQVL